LPPLPLPGTVPPEPPQGTGSPASFSFSGLSAVFGGAIQNGSFTTNGGPRNGGTITIVNSSFSGNSSTGANNRGGAIFNNGSATIANSTFSMNCVGVVNAATFGGGAIFNNGDLFVTGSSFSQNKPAGAGGAINNQGTATIIGSDFDGNSLSAQSQAGAIANQGQMVIANSTIRNNRGSGSGGGAMNNLGAPAGALAAASLTITDTTFSNNGITITATGGLLRGGALTQQAPLTITGGSFVDNFNESGGATAGGAIGQIQNVVPATAAITGVLFSNNRVVSSGQAITSAIAYGGAFSMQSGTATFTNDTFSGNKALSDVGGAFGGAIANANGGAS